LIYFPNLQDRIRKFLLIIKYNLGKIVYIKEHSTKKLRDYILKRLNFISDAF
jgi:hypothetical protein